MKSPRLKKIWRYLGPGFITGASDNDSSAIITYAIAGAKLGTKSLWTMLYIMPFMIVIQEMSARIGISSSCGLTGNIKKYYSKGLLIFISTLIIVSNTFNIGADVFGMAAAIEMLMPGSNSISIYSWLIVFFSIFLIVVLPYRRIVTIFKWLALSLLTYVLAGLIVINEWPKIIWDTFIPFIPKSKDGLVILVAIFGTTISPYLAFWQASEEAEEEKLKRHEDGKKMACEYRIVTKNELRRITGDTRIGMLFSNLTGFFIIALTASVLFSAGINNVETVKDAAEALRPLVGDFAYILFGLGLISSGLLVIPILAGSSAYVLSEIFNWNEGLDKPFSKAKEFYLIMVIAVFIGLIIPYAGISPVKALFWTSIIHGFIAPFLIGTVLHMANNPKIVGPNVNKKSTNLLGYLAFVIMILVLIVFTISFF